MHRPIQPQGRVIRIELPLSSGGELDEQCTLFRSRITIYVTFDIGYRPALVVVFVLTDAEDWEFETGSCCFSPPLTFPRERACHQRYFRSVGETEVYGQHS